MKKYFILLALTVSLVQPMVFAQTKPASSSADTNAVTPTVSLEEKDIQNLKDKIATKVAELREKNNKAVSGFVIKTGSSSFTIQADNGDEYVIKLDGALTKFYQVAGTQAKEINASDIKQDAFIIVTGVANDKEITANNIYVDEKFLVVSGKITQVNKDDFSLKVTSTDKDTYNLNIETSTKQEMLNSKTLDVERTGFSKIKEGDTIHFVVKKTGKEKDNTYTAAKILIIPQEYFMQ